MRCPQCKQHVTPFLTWATAFKDNPRQCRSCGLSLQPSYRACWLVPIGFLLCVPTFPLIPVVHDWLQAALGRQLPKADFLIVFGPMLLGVFFVGWLTGTYQKKV
jgi:hypothetical protein